MRHLKHFRHLRSLLGPGLSAVAIAVVLSGIDAAQTGSLDAVEDLRLALKPAARTPAELKLRQKTLDERVAKLRGTGDVRRALELAEWRDDPAADDAWTVDQPLRRALYDRFEKTLHEALSGDDPNAQLAAAKLLADIGPSLRTGARSPVEKVTERKKVGVPGGGQMRVLAPDLAKLINRSKDPTVRAAAAIALGKINPDIMPSEPGKPVEIVSELGNLLARGTVTERRAAAAALLNLVQGPAQQLKEKTATFGSEAWEGQAVANAKVIVPVIGPGLRDADVEVRRQAVQTLEEAALAFRARVVDDKEEFPKDRELTKEEKEALDAYKIRAAKEWEDLKPLAEVLRRQGADLIAAINDPDPIIRLRARRAVEELGVARQKLQRKAETMQEPAKGTGALPRPADVADRRGGVVLAQAEAPAKSDKPLDESLRKVLPALIAGLTDSDVEARRAAAEAIESLGKDAAPAAAALTQALDDSDLFVRWIAARTLGKLGAKTASGAIPALAQLLDDPDLDVRVQAATVLGRFGDAAAATVPSLLAAVSPDGDATLVATAIKSLVSIGKQKDEVMSALVRAFSARDARIRRAAAEALGKFGPAARGHVDALRAHLDDPDLDVRKAMGDALLSVTQAPPEK
jgi:HEAT repeat protein